MAETLSVNGKEYTVIRLLGKGKGGYSYLVTDGQSEYVLKQIHHEPCDFYSFGDKLASELRDYETLRAIGIPMPELLAVDRGQERLLKEYIEGETVSSLIEAGRADPDWIPQVQAMCRLLYPAGLNIDYYPTNFVCRGGQLCYIDYECNQYMEEWDFEHWGMQYWRGKRNMKRRDPVFKNYTDADYEAVCDFLIALNRDDKMHIHWNWARFEWMAEHPEFDKSLRSAIGLWLDGDIIVGAAIYDMYFGEAFCAALPEYQELYPEILHYAWENLKDENGLGIAIRDDDTGAIEEAGRQGFVPADQTETIMEIALSGALPVDLPEGFTIAELDPLSDLDAFQWLLWQGFDHGEDRAEYEQSEDAHVDPAQAQPRRHFDKRLSLTAVGPDGQMAAYCCLWYSEKTDYAYVEPVCTVPSRRGMGLARAILDEAMNRAHSLGAKKAYVISDQIFYEKLGFRKAQHFTFYWKR